MDRDGDSLEIVVRVRRFAPGVDASPYWREYRVTRVPRMTVLDALYAIQNEQDDTLSFRAACRVAMCGSCGMMVNGRPRLTCQTSVEGVGRRFDVAPLSNLPVIKDLVVDMDAFFEKWKIATPYLVARDPAAPPASIPPGSKERGIIDENLECITCGLCFAGCGSVASNPHYLGPAALNRAYALVQDGRDALPGPRLDRLDGPDGVWGCHHQFACTELCPKHLNPAHTIQQLRTKIIRRRISRLWGNGQDVHDTKDEQDAPRA